MARVLIPPTVRWLERVGQRVQRNANGKIVNAAYGNVSSHGG